jgi:hypothetical protein
MLSHGVSEYHRPGLASDFGELLERNVQVGVGPKATAQHVEEAVSCDPDGSKLEDSHVSVAIAFQPSLKARKSRAHRFNDELRLKIAKLRSHLIMQFVHVRHEQHHKLVVRARDRKLWRPQLHAGEERIWIGVNDCSKAEDALDLQIAFAGLKALVGSKIHSHALSHLPRSHAAVRTQSL